MKWIADAPSFKSKRYEVRYDSSVGFYLFVYENDKCVPDHLQDTLEIAMECALEDYGVSKSLWQKIEE